MQFQVPLADDPNFQAIARERNYTEGQIEQIDKFSRDGYLVIDLGISDFDEVVDGIKKDLSSLKDGRAQDAWDISPHVRRLATLKIVTDTLDLLYGRKSFPFQTLNFPGRHPAADPQRHDTFSCGAGAVYGRCLGAARAG